MLLVKDKGLKWIKQNINKITYTDYGSILYLLYGKILSEQSTTIKMGLFGEFLIKEIVKESKLKLLRCGLQKINNKKRDVDLLFEDVENKIIYYRELKGNINLDSEKIKSTINKCHKIKSYFTIKYPEHKINYGILTWSIYDKEKTKLNSKYKIFETEKIKVDSMKDFLCIVNMIWEENDFYMYFRDIGKKFKL